MSTTRPPKKKQRLDVEKALEHDDEELEHDDEEVHTKELPEKMQEVLKSSLSSTNIRPALRYILKQYDAKAEFHHVLDEGQVSLSHATFEKMACRVGLEPFQNGRDIKTFHMSRCRIPTPLLKEIVQDVELLLKQYGPVMEHNNEEARSRVVAPIFNRLVSKFELLIVNTPETLIQGQMTKKGRVEYQCNILGVFMLVFVEVKQDLVAVGLRKNAIAQVIAEADACDCENRKKGSKSYPVHGILSDGIHFKFYRFDGSTEQPTFKEGLLCTPTQPVTTHTDLQLPERAGTTNATKYIITLRFIAEGLFNIFLHGFRTGLDAQLEIFESSGDKESALECLNAKKLASEVIDMSSHAAELAAGGDVDNAERLAEDAFGKLKECIRAVPPRYQRDDWNLMVGWQEDIIRAA